MIEVGMHEAKTRLSQLVEEVHRGEEVVITRRGKPVARLERVRTPSKKRQAVLGSWKGKVWMADDFDELPDDIAEAFGMK